MGSSLSTFIKFNRSSCNNLLIKLSLLSLSNPNLTHEYPHTLYSLCRSRSRSRSPRRHNRSHQDSRKLASTLRSRRTPSSPESDSKGRRASRSRSRSRRRRSRSRSRSSSSSSSDHSRYRDRRTRRRSSRRGSSEKQGKREKTPSEPKESKESSTNNGGEVNTAKEVMLEQKVDKGDIRSPSRKRSESVEGAKFMSLKRKERSKTPDWSNNNTN